MTTPKSSTRSAPAQAKEAGSAPVFSSSQARAIGQKLGIDWAKHDVDLEQFRLGLAVELEHGSQDPATDVTHNDEVITGKIVLAHLHELPDYYTRLAEMERDAED